MIEVTEAVTIAGNGFEFAGDYRGLEVLEKKGSLIGATATARCARPMTTAC